MTTKTDQQAGVAKLTNVGLAMTAMKQIVGATSQMPRIAVLSGMPGYGKSQAAMYLTHPAGANAVYICLRMFDTTKTLAQLIATELDGTCAGKMAGPPRRCSMRFASSSFVMAARW